MSSEITNPVGRPPIEIDWDAFSKLLEFQATKRECASFFDCSEETIENKIRDKYGCNFSAFKEQKGGKGKISLRRRQFEVAMNGNVTMLIWLGKQWLQQTDKTESTVVTLDAAPVKKMSFVEFCENAGYPLPYPKQIEMKNFGINSEGPRIILGARGYGKTEYVGIMGVAYEIYLNPTGYRSLLITKSSERNKAILKEIYYACEKAGVKFEINNATSLRAVGLTGKDHSISAVTIGTCSLRGRHPDLVIMDDPVTPEDTSEATRLRVEKVYNEVYKLTPNILIVGQPVHKFDLYQKLRPVLNKMEVPYGSIPELDSDLDAQRLAGIDEATIQASYFLNILSEGSVPFEKIRYMKRFPVGDDQAAVAFVDPSFEGGDYTALTIMKAYMQGVAVVGFNYKKAWNHCLDEIYKRCQMFHVKRLCFESNALGDQPIEIMRQQFDGIGIVGRKSNTNKHSRIMAAGSFAHMIHLSKESDPIYTKHVVEYEYKAKYDDAPDSLASCLTWLGLIRGKI